MFQFPCSFIAGAMRAFNNMRPVCVICFVQESQNRCDESRPIRPVGAQRAQRAHGLSAAPMHDTRSVHHDNAERVADPQFFSIPLERGTKGTKEQDGTKGKEVRGDRGT